MCRFAENKLALQASGVQKASSIRSGDFWKKDDRRLQPFEAADARGSRRRVFLIRYVGGNFQCFIDREKCQTFTVRLQAGQGVFSTKFLTQNHEYLRSGWLKLGGFLWPSDPISPISLWFGFYTKPLLRW